MSDTQSDDGLICAAFFDTPVPGERIMMDWLKHGIQNQPTYVVRAASREEYRQFCLRYDGFIDEEEPGIEYFGWVSTD
jgi:hypothetical protein